MLRRALPTVTGLLALVAGPAVPTTAAGAAPNDPRDDSAQQSRDDVANITSRIDDLAKQLAEAKSALNKAQTELAAAYEKVTTAQRKARSARAAAERTQKAAETTRAEADAAKTKLRAARKKVDELTARSFQLGDLGSVRAYLGAESVQDVIARSSMLGAISASRSADLATLRSASERKTRKQAAAEQALEKAKEQRTAAESTAAAAKRAYEQARAGEQATQRRAEKLVERQQSLRARLDRARRELDDSQSGQASDGAAAVPAPVQVAAREVVAPAEGTLTSTYGPRGGSIHYGLDIANRIGTPVVAAMDGVVVESGPASGFGLWVRVRHDNGLVTVYGHIHRSLVSTGQRVSAGQRIATIGNRGQSSGPHLHFETHRSGSKINPLTWLRANGVSW